MGVILFLVFGLVIGLLARAIMPGTQRMGMFMTAMLGVAGSFVGGLLASLLTHRPMDELNTAGVVGSVVGALVILFVVGKVGGNRLAT
jgi:uncharacterized membrane protein YeaQ/YmgE (transglycosylase-associated protein family)